MPERALASDATSAPSVPISTPSGLRLLEGGRPQTLDGARTETTDRPPARLEIPAYDLEAALALERELAIGHTLAQVLVRRGLTDAVAARSFLDAAETHPPTAFARIDQAVDLIQRHIRARAPITIHGDYDVDGVCATAILVRALRALGGDVDWYIPSRTDDGYGLSTGTVERLAARGTQLLITADCAITAIEEVERARTVGLEVIVTDHHHPRSDGALPACAIVHPSVCAYPCAELCGTAVAFKLAQALGAPTAQDDVELVALATVADLMPLRGENRRLVREGLAALANTAKPGLRALMAVSRADPSALDAQTLAFRLAPRINAAGRLRRADAGLELLLTGDERRAGEIAEELDRLNAERRAVEQQILWAADAQASGLVDRDALVLSGDEWHPGVIGIVASRIVERYHRPAVLVAFDADGAGQGSGRSIPGFDLLGALEACADKLERYGGHRAAAGLTIRRERFDEFRTAFERHAAQVLTAELLQQQEVIDAIVSGSELGLGLVEELERLEPSGMGNPRPKLLLPGARFSDARPMGEGRHARFTVTAGGARTPAVAFACGSTLPGAASGADARNPPAVDASFRLERNTWNGVVAPRLVLRNTWLCATAPIEVIGERGSYLTEALEELERPLSPRPELAGERSVLDRRGESPLAVLADAISAGGPVLAVCADVARRIDGLRSRTGGFSLTSYHALEVEPAIAPRFRQLVALDPPACDHDARLLRAGTGFAHLTWGEPELRFAQQINEMEYGLRTSLVALYRGLRSRGRVAGEELEQLLRGDRSPGRPARLAGRLIRVLAELELVSLDRDLPALALAGGAPTALERSPAYRAYATRHEDGRRFLNDSARRPAIPAPQRR